MNKNSAETPAVKFFGVVARGQSYLNIIYLLLALPLGIGYFTFVVTGISVGVGLVIVWVGIPILLLVLAGWYGLVAFERLLAIWLLRVDVPSMEREPPDEKGLWARLKATLICSRTGATLAAANRVTTPLASTATGPMRTNSASTTSKPWRKIGRHFFVIL